MSTTSSFVKSIFFDLVIYLIIYSVLAGGAFLIFWVWKNQKFKSLRIQEKIRSNFGIIRKEIIFSIISLIIFSLMDVIIFYGYSKGYTKLYSSVSEFGWGYLIFSLFLMLILHDTYFYWIHRLIHWKPLFRIVHKIHHKSIDPSPFAAFSFHPLEAVCEYSIYVLIAFTIPVHGGTLLAFQIVSTIFNVIAHLGYEIYPKNFLKSKLTNWKTTSTHHNMHHEKFEGNYGLYFSFWDKWCKTEFYNYEKSFDKITNGKGKKYTGEKTNSNEENTVLYPNV